MGKREEGRGVDFILCQGKVILQMTLDRVKEWEGGPVFRTLKIARLRSFLNGPFENVYYKMLYHS